MLLSVIALMALNPSHSLAQSFTKNLTVTKGVTFSVDPLSDMGLGEKWVKYEYHEYSVSNKNDLSVYEHYYTRQSSQTSTTLYYFDRYDLTPKKVGTCTFSFSIQYDTYFKASITYTINVVDLNTISIPSILNLTVGNTYKITPALSPSDAVNTLTWESLNKNIATVSNGLVTAVGVGKTMITCTADNGVSSQCEVNVSPIYINSMVIEPSEIEMTVAEQQKLNVKIYPDNATIKNMTWSSTNDAVAVVDESGLVTAVGSGTCQVKATANDGSGKTASCLITVEKNNKLTVTDMTQCSGGRGVLNVLLTDEETIMGFQFDLKLPAGVTVAEKDGKLLAQLTGNAVNTHSISSSKVSDGQYRFVVTPQGSRAISQETGDGMTITIDVADNVTVGSYEMSIKDIEMTVKKAGNVLEDIHPKNSTAMLTIIEAVMGDVNGDGRVSVTDVISMNSYILEEEPAQFIRKVADLNGDGKVTITDMVQVIDIILGK